MFGLGPISQRGTKSPKSDVGPQNCYISRYPRIHMQWLSFECVSSKTYHWLNRCSAHTSLIWCILQLLLIPHEYGVFCNRNRLYRTLRASSAGSSIQTTNAYILLFHAEFYVMVVCAVEAVAGNPEHAPQRLDRINLLHWTPRSWGYLASSLACIRYGRTPW